MPVADDVDPRLIELHRNRGTFVLAAVMQLLVAGTFGAIAWFEGSWAYALVAATAVVAAIVSCVRIRRAAREFERAAAQRRAADA